MLTLVTGGSASGKSEYAEGEVLALGEGRRIYLATMMPFDEECRRRIARHRRMRARKGFETIERYTGLAGIQVPKNCVVLLECLSNLVANEIYSPQGAGEQGAFEAVEAGIQSLCRQARAVVVVSNEVFSDGGSYDASTMRYLEILGALNCRLGELAQRVVEVVYSIPVVHKAPGISDGAGLVAKSGAPAGKPGCRSLKSGA